jgi:branched-chain amino acid transport system ATP-binding protein
MGDGETTSVMEIRSVGVAYQGDIRILDGVSIKLRAGGITGLIGPNGAGKSTALKTFYGLLKPTSGDVLLDGRVITGMAPWRYVEHGVAFVPQGRSVFGDLTLEDNLRLSCWVFRRDKARMARALERCFALFPSLADARRQKAGTLSGGQQRFLEIARGLVSEPKVLLLDEPTAMIAPKFASEIYEFIHGLPKQGISVLLVDQNVRQCVRISDHIYILELGRNRADGSGAQFRSDDALRDLINEWVEYRVDA